MRGVVHVSRAAVAHDEAESEHDGQTGPDETEAPQAIRLDVDLLGRPEVGDPQITHPLHGDTVEVGHAPGRAGPVSYTHLTLPTIYSV